MSFDRVGKICWRAGWLDLREAVRTGGDTGPAVVPGHPEESLLLEGRQVRIRPGDAAAQNCRSRKIRDRDLEIGLQWARAGSLEFTGAKIAQRAAVDIESGRKFLSHQKPQP